MTGELGDCGRRHYFLHVGPSILPRRQAAEPMTLAEAMCRASGLRYAVVYRLDEDNAPVPVVAAAGSAEVIHLPTGRRLPREMVVPRPR